MKKLLTATLLAFTTISVASAQVNPLLYRLAAYYPFSGNAQDALGNTPGTPVGGTTWIADRNGLTNGSLHLDGQTGYVDLGNSLDTVFAGPNSQFAITAWVKLDDSSYDWTYNRLIVNKSADSGCGEAQHEFYFRYLDGQVNFSFAGIGRTFARYINTSYTITDTLWHHLAVTYDATQWGNDGLDRVKLYVDGLAKDTRILPISYGALGDINAGTGHLGIGNRLGSAGQPCPTFDVPGFFQGAIDDVAIYNRLLTPVEVSILASPLRNGPMSTPKELALQLTVFPTKSVDGHFRVHKLYSGPCAYTVLNAVGQSVMCGVLDSADSEINLARFSKGLYMVRFSQAGSAVTTRVVFE